MGIPEILELGGLFLLAATKFAVAAGILVSPATDYSYFETFLILISGGFTGILFFAGIKLIHRNIIFNRLY